MPAAPLEGHLAAKGSSTHTSPTVPRPNKGGRPRRQKTEGPLYGAAAPGGGGRTGLDAEQADAAGHLPQPSGPHPATLRETRPVTDLASTPHRCGSNVDTPIAGDTN